MRNEFDNLHYTPTTPQAASIGRWETIVMVVGNSIIIAVCLYGAIGGFVYS